MATQRKWHSPITSGTYGSWRAMLGRCLDPSNIAYSYYGGRGVTICSEWITDYDRFYADMGERPPGMTLDRENGELGYSPDNCRWADKPTQMNNQRRTVNITHLGETLTLSQWATRLGVPYYTLWNRIRLHGMSPDKALTANSLDPTQKHGNGGYTRGCRCEVCKLARREYHMTRKQRQNK